MKTLQTLSNLQINVSKYGIKLLWKKVLFILQEGSAVIAFMDF